MPPPQQGEGYFLVLGAATVVALTMTLLRVDPIALIFWSNIVAALIAPVLLIAILLVGNHQAIMQNQRLRPLHIASLVLIAVILMAAAILLFYGMATG